MAVMDGKRANPRRAQLLGDAPGAFAEARYVRATAMKTRRVVDLIRGLPAKEALTVLRFAPQSASDQVFRVLESAVANAEHNERLDPDALMVSQAFVDEGPTMKRFRPRAQGRAYRIRKRTCHITVVVESVAPVRTKRSAAKSTAKATTTKTTTTKTTTTKTTAAKSAAAKGTDAAKVAKEPAKASAKAPEKKTAKKTAEKAAKPAKSATAKATDADTETSAKGSAE